MQGCGYSVSTYSNFPSTKRSLIDSSEEEAATAQAAATSLLSMPQPCALCGQQQAQQHVLSVGAAGQR